MTNHVHLLVSSADADSPSLLMKHLAQRHVQRINRAQGRTGTLWEGRFRSSLVQQERYLFACYRYIELNPVRAGMVTHPEDYEWSSYRSNAGLDRSPVVKAHEAYRGLGESDFQRGRAYRAMLPASPREDDVHEIRAATNAGFAIGDDAFKARMARILGRRVLPGSRGRPPAHIADKNGTDPLNE